MRKGYDLLSTPGKPERTPGTSGWVVAFLVAVACLMSVAGCGYTLQQRLKDGFTNPHGLFVPVFRNDTDEVGAERVFTNALIRELQSRGDMVITQRRPGAYEVRGAVSRITYSPSALTVTPFKGLQDYRRLPTEVVVNVHISLQLVNPKDEQVLWSGSFSGFRRVSADLSRTYDFEAPSSLALMQQSLIESQYSGIARDIMRDVYDSIVEFF